MIAPLNGVTKMGNYPLLEEPLTLCTGGDGGPTSISEGVLCFVIAPCPHPPIGLSCSKRGWVLKATRVSFWPFLLPIHVKELSSWTALLWVSGVRELFLVLKPCSILTPRRVRGSYESAEHHAHLNYSEGLFSLNDSSSMAWIYLKGTVPVLMIWKCISKGRLILKPQHRSKLAL